MIRPAPSRDAAAPRARRLMFVVNNAAFFESHRLPVAQAAMARGWQVSLCTGQEASPTLAAGALPRLARSGIAHTRLAFRSAGMNPLVELLGLWQLVRQMRRERPDVVHCASPKGVLYGALAARLAGVPALVIAVSGVGYAFTDGADPSGLRSVLRSFIAPLSAWAWGHANKRVIVQNRHDRNEVRKRGWAATDEVRLLPGSGVRLDHFVDLPVEQRPNVVVLPARLLADKGVLEFVQAARELRAVLPSWRFVLVGTADYDNPSAVACADVERWVAEGVVQWWGHREDMPAVYAQARIVCLPSYREGMPRSLLEAAAAACAVVTTDVPGCRDAIVDGHTGVLVPPRNAAALARALQALCLDEQRIDRFARAGRAHAQQHFDLQAVVERTLDLYGELVVPTSSSRLALIQLNEIDFDIVRHYLARMHLPRFKRLLSGSMTRTRAESEYDLLEPWIQWPSIYTGLDAKAHGLRRLGDAVGHAAPQIFETLEQHGLRVGCISPINAENRLCRPAYFIPDPWTATRSDGSAWSRRLAEAVTQVVNDNAKGDARGRSLAILALAIARFSRLRHWLEYARLALGARGRPWRKALLLDLLLADLHHALGRSSRPSFATLFLNAGAHIQHHYLLSSPVVRASAKNPSGYVRAGEDPMADMLRLYDRLLGSLLDQPGQDWIVATGLSQRPCESQAFYWRLREHESFLRRAGIGFVRVRPRMSRDFLIECANETQAREAEIVLSQMRVEPGRERLFGEVDNRGASVFVTLTHAGPVDASHHVALDGRPTPLLPEVALVALKNGRHESEGHACFSPGVWPLAPPDGAHVRQLHQTIRSHFGLAPQSADLHRAVTSDPRIEEAQHA